jgi:glutathione S-transferase
MVGYGAFDVMLDTVEKAVAKGGYIAADRFTAADLYLGSQIGFGIQFGTIEKRQAFADYWGRVSDREACRRAVKLDDDAAAAAAAAKH